MRLNIARHPGSASARKAKECSTLIEQAGLDVIEVTLAPFGVDHFEHQFHFDGTCWLEALNIRVEQGGVLVAIFIG